MEHGPRFVLGGLVFVVALWLPTAAQAAKETFVRSKPHVNIGSIGHVDRGTQSVLVTLSLVGLPGPGGSSAAPPPDCSGSFDVRIRDASDLGGPPLFQEDGLPLRANASVVVEWPPDTGAGVRTPLLYEVTARGENIDGRHCVFRGLVEVRDPTGGCAARALALRPEDFILLR